MAYWDENGGESKLGGLLTVRNAILFALLVMGGVVWFAMPKSRPLEEIGPFNTPKQRNLSRQEALVSPEGWMVSALAEYEIEALVVSRKRYRFDEISDLVPVDVLLVWGPLSLEPNLSGINWSQSNRWGYYRYQYADVSLADKDIAYQSANTHLIAPPDDPYVESQIKKIRKGDAVRLKGYLVRAFRNDGLKVESSMTRNDTGANGCEVMYVTEVEFLNH